MHTCSQQKECTDQEPEGAAEPSFRPRQANTGTVLCDRRELGSIREKAHLGWIVFKESFDDWQRDE
jgi:hypothetical protein